MQLPESILDFWLNRVGPEGWYKSSPELDAEIRNTYMQTWREAAAGKLDGWLTQPRNALALIILLDQFPRNMFRDRAEAFSSDAHARYCAKRAIGMGHDLRIDPPERQFFYMPLMHSECHTDQDRCVRLFQMRMPGSSQDNLLHARAHREIIRRFGRFPTRNAALGRENSPAERAYLEQGGYRGIVEELAQAA
ncbi:MAG: DUF924 domain-containing protein [Alphaproteobacteria bacterium]|nr:MAG: DUF924 domain-containing protein [Alphaproteobacteria bacterium]